MVRRTAEPVAVPSVRSVAGHVARAARERPDHVAFVEAASGRSQTWRELDDDVSLVAAGLRTLGLRDGDRVALLIGNTIEFAVSYFAVLRAGLVAVPLNTGYPARELRSLLGDAGAAVVVVAPELLATAREAASGLPTPPSLVRTADAGDVVSADGAGEETSLDALREAGRGGPAVDAAEEEPAPEERERLAVLLYTSGTSGRPRGAMLSGRALLANLEQCAAISPAVTTPDDVVLVVLPLFHVYGLNACLGAVARQGATGVLVDRFDPRESLALLRDRGVTNVVGAPPMYVAWSMLPDVGDAFRGVRLMLSGAAPLPRDVHARVLELTGHHVFEGYGLTETAPVVSTTLLSPHPRPGSIGRPVPGVEVELRDPRGEVVDDGDPGEIVVRGANLFSGYWPDGAEGPDPDGWWGTGDVAVQDEIGDLTLVDRRRELILVSGFNVYPREVEQVLLEHPAVRDVAVLGVPHPYTGEAVKAVVVLEDGATVSEDELRTFSTARLARFKCPAVVEVVDELPYSATGKVSKGRLRDAGFAAAPVEPPADELF